MKIASGNIKSQISPLLKKLARYEVIFFIIFLAALYTYLIIKIDKAVTIQPGSTDQGQISRSVPKVDPSVVQKLQQLQDNSVSVQALFNQARSNPFSN